MYIYIYVGTSQNTRYGSRPRTHTRSIPPDPYLDPYPMILHDPYPWSIPLIHTPDPYPFLVEERLMLALMLLFLLILLLVLVLLHTPVATTVVLLLPPLPPLAASAASAASVLLLLLPLLVIFLPGAAATAVASAAAPAAPAGPASAAGADSLPPCASGSWTNATNWLATSNTASAPWTLVRPVLVPLGASCASIVALWLQFFCFAWHV